MQKSAKRVPKQSQLLGLIMAKAYRKKFMVLLLLVGLLCILGLAAVYAWQPNPKPKTQQDTSKTRKTGSTQTTQPSTPGPSTPGPSTPETKPAAGPKIIDYAIHSHIITTVFWVGEGANADNGNIANSASTWDGQWAQHFGGVDSPNERSGWLPVGFTPNENPFYVALPYSDFTDNGSRRPDAGACPLAPKQNPSEKPYSWCKNSWVAVTNESTGAICYGQWEDAGPYGEADGAYVLGNSLPESHRINSKDVDAALDVSPAMRDCLGAGDESKSSWHFANAQDIPNGPWKKIVTTSLGEHI